MEIRAVGEAGVQFGLIAEEVAEVFPELVTLDGEGRAYAVKYRFLPSLLLNELQKQARLNKEQQLEIERLRSPPGGLYDPQAASDLLPLRPQVA